MNVGARRAETDLAKLQAYREGWRRRREDEERAEEERWHGAMSSAQQIADRLRARWGAREVLLFGSVARRALGHGRVRADSDIGIAVTGVDRSSYFAMFADIDRIAPMSVDVVLMEDCSTGLRDAIGRDGIQL